MLKQLIKKIIIWLLKTTNLHALIIQVQYDKKVKNYNSLLVNNGATFYIEAEVINLANDKNRILVGEKTHVRGELLMYHYAKTLQIGNNCYIGKGTIIRVGEEVIIGNNVLIAHNVNIIDTDSHEINHLERSASYNNLILKGHPLIKGNINTSPIIIGDYAWINFNSIILKGVIIGEGAIIGAGSVVTKDVPPYTLYAGNPAKFVKKLYN
jgi:acetyltransferase-like isoleucine patch superfamily enzyme